jgi:amino acid transporter
MDAAEQAKSFFLAYLAAPIVIVFYASHKLWFKTSWYVKTKEMDLDTGRRNLNTKELIAEAQAERDSWPKWKKVYKVVC